MKDIQRAVSINKLANETQKLFPNEPDGLRYRKSEVCVLRYRKLICSHPPLNNEENGPDQQNELSTWELFVDYTDIIRSQRGEKTWSSRFD